MLFRSNARVAAIKEERDQQIADIFAGKDDRLLLIIGPCSADSEDAVLDYLYRLAKVADRVKDKIFIIPRVYTNKPRTTGLGYKGMLHQPDPDAKEDMLTGIIAIREMHTRAVRETGFTCAEEMLYPENHRYLSDLLAYVAVGARSVEDQQHRIVASGIGIPAGMKNPTSGDISVMMNSLIRPSTVTLFSIAAGKLKPPAIRWHMPFCGAMSINMGGPFPIIIMRICRDCSMPITKRPSLKTRR